MARIPIDFGDPDAELAAAQDYASRLPVELPQQQPGFTHTYQPGWDAQLVQEEADKANPLVFAPAIKETFSTSNKLVRGEVPFASAQEVYNRLTGANNTERFQTWPEQMVRSGLSLPADVYSGRLPVMQGEHTNPELIQRAQDIAGMAGGGSVAGVGNKAATLSSVGLHNEPRPIDMQLLRRQEQQQTYGTGRLMSDTTEPAAAIAGLERAPIFYSALEHAVQNAKVLKANAEDWLGYLRNQPGVKAEELDWVLHDLPKGQITKSELEQFVNEHKVELKEVNKGAFSNYEQKRYEELNKKADEGILSEIENAEWDNLQQQVLNEDKTKYSQWQLPGGSGYKEQLLTLPSELPNLRIARDNNIQRIEDLRQSMRGTIGSNEIRAEIRKLQNENDAIFKQISESSAYQSSHWDEPDVLAHIRMNERAIAGVGNSLHIEEIQSDWHQAGRKQGYKGEADRLAPEFEKIEKKIIDSNDESILANPDIKDALKIAINKDLITKNEGKLYERYSQITTHNLHGGDIPNAPFKTNWADLALKRIIRQAAEHGNDSISWTPGEAQAARYDLSKHIDNLQYNPETKKLIAWNGDNRIIDKGNVSIKELPDYIGKDASDKLINSPSKRNQSGSLILEGLDLKIGGEGMKAFYDKMLVDKANAIAKKFGGKVEQSNLGKNEYSIEKGLAEWNVVNTQKPYNTIKSFDSAKEAKQFIDQMKNEGQPIHVLRITPQLRDAALNKGFSLFADTGKVGAPLAALTRVEHNPFKLGELEKQHGVKLTPVTENPFTVDTYHGSPKPFIGNTIGDNVTINQNLNGSWGVYYEGKQVSPDYKTKEIANANYLQHNSDTTFFSTPNPKLAGGNFGKFGYSNPTGIDIKGNVLPLKINPKNYHSYDAKGKTWQEVNDFAIDEANQLGKKGVIITNVIDNPSALKDFGPQTVYITLDPSTVRSKFAKFDPAKYGESGLLKSSGLPIYSDENGNQLVPPPKNPSQVDLPPWAISLGLKAEEYAIWLATRHMPSVNGAMWMTTAAQWPMISRNIKNEIARQRTQGKDINEIMNSIPMLNDIMNLGKPPPKITPIEGNPFK